MIGIVIIFLVIYVILYWWIFKKEPSPPPRYTNINYRIVYEPLGLLGIKWGYFGEIYTTGEIVLMRVGPFQERRDAIEKTEETIDNLKKSYEH